MSGAHELQHSVICLSVMWMGEDTSIRAQNAVLDSDVVSACGTEHGIVSSDRQSVTQ